MKTRVLICAIGVLAFASPALYGGEKDDSQYVQATLIRVQQKKHVIYSAQPTSSAVPNGDYTQNVPAAVIGTERKTYAFTVQIGDTLYTGAAANEKDARNRLSSGIAGHGWGNFNAKEWANGGENGGKVLVRFEKKGALMHSIGMVVKRPNGKEAFTMLMSIVGPDGKEQCSKKMGCTGSHWDGLPQPDPAGAPAPSK